MANLKKLMVNFVKKRWYIVLVIAIFVGGYLYTSMTTQTKAKVEKTYTVNKQVLTDTLSLSGSIDADEQANLRFQSSGRLSWVGVKEGDYVQKYQGIAALDQREVQNNLKQYLNDYMTARWSYDQAVDDNKDQHAYGISQQLRDEAGRLIEKAQFNLNNSVLDVELKQLAIEYSYLSTPIEGIVVKATTATAGVNVTPTSAEFTIINPKTLFFSATADQTDVVKLKDGMQGEIVLDPYPDDKITGEIKSIAFTPKAGETGTVYEIKMPLDSTKANYRLGMTGDVNFDLEGKKAVLAIPTAAIQTENDKKFIYKKITNGRVKTYIKIGEVLDGQTEITSGLKEGDVIYYD